MRCAGTWTLDSLLGSRCNVESVKRRMFLSYSSQVSLALQTGNMTLALDTYRLAEALPSLATREHFGLEGFQLNGTLFEGSSLIIAFRGLCTFVIKPLGEQERQRVTHLTHALNNRGFNLEEDTKMWASYADLTVVHRHVIPFILWSDPLRKERCFMAMPKLSGTLEPLQRLSDAETGILCNHVTSALSCLHAMKFAHGDVKPGNIGLREGPPAQFVLIDLGSVQTFGTRVSATLPYVPCDLQHGTLLASANVDWWMFAVTLAEKCCGDICFSDIGQGRWSMAARPTDQIVAHLSTYLPREVWTAFKEVLVAHS